MNAIVTRSTILRGEVGSTALGTNISDASDHDEMGVFVEPRRAMLGLTDIEHYRYRTAQKDQRSGPGDLDLVLYGLRKYCRLAVKGNPSILVLLHLPRNGYSTVGPLGDELVSIRSAFWSRSAGAQFLGYLRGQKAKLNGQRSPCVSRPELVARYGYDTKFAGHALRLGLMGIEYMRSGTITIPIPDAQLIRSVRSGVFELRTVLERIERCEMQLVELVEHCTGVADIEKIEQFMCHCYETHWRNP